MIRAAVRAGASRKNVVAAGARAREASIEREGPMNRIASTLRVLAHIGALLAAVVVPTLIVSRARQSDKTLIENQRRLSQRRESC